MLGNLPSRLITVAVCVLCSSVALGEPLLPAITGHDFHFGAFNGDQNFEYATNNVEPDTLIYTRSESDHEVIAYWPDWPNPPVYPVWDLGDPASFGGDFVLQVQFTGQDAPIGSLDVSLTGTGLNPDGADLEIYGTVDLDGNVLSGLLWAIDLEDVSLYGHSGDDSYSLEGIGTVVAGEVATEFGLLGLPGVMRGGLDLFGYDFPSLYDPGDEVDVEARADYSGETGVPEPTGIGLALVGLGALRRRRR